MIERRKSELVKILMSGDLAGAREKVASLSTKDQHTGFVQNFLGTISLKEANLQDAVEYFGNAIALDSNYGAPFKNLALAYLQLGEFELALLNIDKALRLSPGDLDALHTKGYLKLRSGNFDDAIADLEKCLSGSPQNPQFLNTIGLAYFGADEFLIAKRHFSKALEILPDFDDAFLNLAKCERQLGNYMESNRILEGLLERKPKNEIALFDLANNLLNTGKEAAARVHLETLLDIWPTNGNAHNLLSQIDRIVVNDKLFIRMQQTLENSAGLSEDDLMHFHHALYKCYERSGNFKNAFINLKMANEHQAKKRPLNNKRPYNIAQDHELFESISALEAIFPITEFRHQEVQKPAPIFIVGLPRSGTSLIETIVSNHPDVQALGELTYLTNAIEKTGLLTAKANASMFDHVRQRYFSKARQHGLNRKYFIDKMPLNFRWIGVILRSIPEAKIIHMCREPQATCFSIYTHLFSGNLGFDNKMSDIAAYYRLYNELMKVWLTGGYRSKIFHLNYDNFVDQPAELSRKLFDYLNLDWNPAFIETRNSHRAVATASRMQVRRSIYKGSSSFWKRYEAYIDRSILDLSAFESDGL